MSTAAKSRTERPPPAAAHLESTTETKVLRQFRSVFNAVKSHFQQVEKRAGIGGAQVWALSTIQAQPGIGMNALATALDIHQTTASNLVKALLQLELVRAEKNGPDKRAVQLFVQPKARGVLKKAPGPFSGVLPTALAALDAPTLIRLEEDLGRLLALLQTDDKAAKTPLAEL
jgi:DNA-binding MarR family transcriptional regulator